MSGGAAVGAAADDGTVHHQRRLANGPFTLLILLFLPFGPGPRRVNLLSPEVSENLFWWVSLRKSAKGCPV